MLPSPDILNDYPHGKFVLSNLAAKRAKQLREGAPALVQVDSNHPLTIALAEIAAGKIKPIMPTGSDALIEVDQPPMLLVDDTLPAELGMLLPALDETEAALISAVALEEDHEHDADHEAEGEDVLSLSDLVDDEEEVAAVSSDDDTLSLSDIADAETAADEDEASEE
ncbi:MAG TPA: DNA-directed RNA polymerase subunit omega [Fimbriimonas sp.]|nr:DNA-directed RNA polymerase subunit omega [Fimbriimonas sp.]